MKTLPQILDAGDGMTWDRDLALEATRHILIAMKLLYAHPSVVSAKGFLSSELVVSTVMQVLGGDHWSLIAEQLVDEVITQEAS